MSERYVRIVSIWIHKGQEAAFDAFEHRAAVTMALFGGRIERALRTAPSGAAPGLDSPIPYEVHIVSFPDAAAADAYAHGQTAAILEERAVIIARSVAFFAQEAGPYLP